MIQPLEIKIQEKNQTDFCTGFVISSIAEEYLGEPCDESYSFAMGKLVSEQPLSRKGCPPKPALLGAIEYGVLPKSKSPFEGKNYDRTFLADWRNWKGLDSFTVKPFGSFYKVTNWEKVLSRTSIFAGIYWQSEWDEHPVISNIEEFHKLTPHEVRIIGIKDGMYVIQNSRGIEKGDQGLWYLPKELKKYISHAYYLDPKPWSSPIKKVISLLM